MPILGQFWGMFSCNLWISQDFGAILLIPWQSFAVSQSRLNSIGLSRLLPQCFGFAILKQLPCICIRSSIPAVVPGSQGAREPSPPQSPGLQKSVPALQGFWADILGGLRSGCDLGQSWTNLLHLVAIRLDRVRIALYLQSIHNPQDCGRIFLW